MPEAANCMTNANRAGDLLRQAIERGDKVAIDFLGETVTFAQLAERAMRTADRLARLGVAKGSRVGMMMASHPRFIEVQQALFLLGATVSPLNIYYRPGEVAHAAASCALEFIVLDADLAERLPLAQRRAMSDLRAAIIVGSTRPAPGFALLGEASDGASGQAIAPAFVAPDDIAMLLNTSATTGKSKGVMLTAANLAANYDRTPGWLGLDEADVILCALPLYNTFGLNQAINAMFVTGAKLVLLPRFEASRCIDAIRRHQCTFMPAVPTMLQKIADHPGLWRGALDSLRLVMTGGAPVPAPLLSRVLAATSPAARMLTGYGLTEGTALVTLALVSLLPDGTLVHGKTIGRVLEDMELEVADDDGRLLPRGATGEFVVRGPNLMAGYYNAPEDTAQALRKGWLHTGDIGYVDHDGHAFIVDRKKDIIIRGGQNIYPADIEEVLYAIDGVAEAAVVGLFDPVLGEVPVAFVAASEGMRIDAALLVARCAEELATYKRPHAIHVMSELPKGPTGKILRRALRETPQSVAC